MKTVFFNTRFVTKLMLGIGSLGLLLLGLLYNGYWQFNSPSAATYPIHGIDVSHHQNEIDWKTVQQQNIQFAFIKATEGGDFKDQRFLENWNAAILAGVDVGAYHFFTFCKSGRIQAQNFIETVPKKALVLPPVIDLEFGGNCALKVDDLAVLAEIDTLQLLLEAAYKKKPILYVTHAFYERFLLDKFRDHPLWVRDIYQEPVLKDKRAWIFWQYANRGHLNGIKTYVDMNVFNGSQKAYQRLKSN